MSKKNTTATPSTPKVRKARQVDPALAEAMKQAKEIVMKARTLERDNKLIDKITALKSKLSLDGLNRLAATIAPVPVPETATATE